MTTDPGEEADEYFLDTPPVRAFVGEVRLAITRQDQGHLKRLKRLKGCDRDE